MQEATWFIQSLNKRNETLLKVANCIVKYQEEFFEKGAHAMKPMVLSDISTEVEMHESTISRVTTEKYMHTPRGTFELKYFFSSHVNTENGGTFSSTAIRALIKELISSEPKNKPYSDSQLSEMLNTKGIIVARRTVAKYRESLNIPPSSQRKGI
jgi:RNA polymerase sigma-54 factor